MLPITKFVIALLFLLAQDTLRVSVSLVTVGVRVRDSRGHDVRGLRAEDFSIFDDGEPQKIVLFSEMEQPMTLGILLDHSDSMTYDDKLQRAKEAALTVVRSVREGSEFFYIAFDDTVTVAADFTRDRHQIESTIQGTRPGGGTSLYDAVLKGVELNKKAQLSRQALVIISDGTDQHSRSRLADVLKVVRGSKMQVYSIGYFSGQEEALFRRSGGRIELIDGSLVDNPRVVLQKLARESGAASFFPRSDKELAKAVEDIVSDLHTQYTVAFYPQYSDEESRYHQLRVIVRGRRYDVRARPGYGLEP
jgi:Ca-activated chloride channel family protein